MRGKWILAVALLLLLGAAFWRLYQVPHVRLDWRTPVKQNGLRLARLEIQDDLLRGCGLLVRVERIAPPPPKSPSSSAKPAAAKSLEYKVSVSDSLRSPYPQRSLFVRSTDNGIEFWLPLNHPPSVKYFDVDVKMDGRKAHWRIYPPRSVHTIEKPRSDDEWVRHPEIEVRLGMVAYKERSGSFTLTAGVRSAVIRTSPPYAWLFVVTGFVPEWVTPIPGTPIRLANLAKPGSGGLWFSKNFEGNGVAGPPYTLPYAPFHRYGRIMGYIEKHEEHREILDFTGIPVDIRHDRYGYKYVVPKVPITRVTPSGCWVQLVQQSMHLRGFEDKRWANLAFRVEIPEQAKRASPLYHKYKREPTISRLIRNEESRTAEGPGVVEAITGDVHLVPVKLVRRGNRWVLPEFQIEFWHFLPVGKRITFDRVLPIRIVERR